MVADFFFKLEFKMYSYGLLKTQEYLAICI